MILKIKFSRSWLADRDVLPALDEVTCNEKDHKAEDCNSELVTGNPDSGPEHSIWLRCANSTGKTRFAELRTAQITPPSVNSVAQINPSSDNLNLISCKFSADIAANVRHVD